MAITETEMEGEYHDGKKKSKEFYSDGIPELPEWIRKLNSYLSVEDFRGKYKKPSPAQK